MLIDFPHLREIELQLSPSPLVPTPEPKSTTESHKVVPPETPWKTAKRLLVSLVIIPLVLGLALLTWRNIHPDELVPANSLGVVLGSGQSLKAANDEIDRHTSNTGIPKAKTRVYFRNGFYANITVVDNQEEANEYLTIAKTFGQGAYLTQMESWCSHPQRGDGFVICQSDSTKQ